MTFTVNKKLGFQVYLEGISIPFSSINISESEGNFPTANIVFPVPDSALRLLPGTIVQIFGPVKNKYGEDYIALLFEGELTGLQYSKSSGGRQASILCNSLYYRFYQATIHPVDSLITDKLRKSLEGQAEGMKESRPESMASGAQMVSITPKVIIDGVICNDSKINSGTTNSLKSQIKEKQDTWAGGIGHKGNIEGLSLLSANAINLQFISMMGAGPVVKGDYLPMIQYFLRYYERNDPYFGVQSLSYNLSKSIFVFPNKGKITPFLHKVILDNMGMRLSFSTNTNLTLWEILRTFMHIAYYNMVCPASPTETKPFWVSARDSKIIIPNRLFFLPSLENSPPAKFNVIFPNQIVSFSYQRDMTGEATRVVGEMGVPFFNPTIKAIKGINVCVVMPQLETKVDNKYKLVSNLTVEETYRGIRPCYENIDYMLSSATNLVKKDYGMYNSTQDLITLEGTFGKDKEGYSTISTGFGTSFRHLVAESYLAHKYEKRLVSVMCEWSPYRMAGIPGAIIDDEGPSIVGIVSSINTEISSEGKAISTISFRGPRLVFDDEFNDDFQGTGADVNDSTNINNYLVNDFSNDGFLDINRFLFDEDMYAFKNIGYNLYSYFASGRESSVTEPFSSLKGKGEPYQRFSDNLSAQSSKRSTGDYSILYYLRSSTIDTNFKIPTDFIDEKVDTTEIVNSKLIFLALQEAKRRYLKAKTNGFISLSDFVTAETWRAVISKENYFNSIGVDSSPRRAYDYKDGVAVFGSVAKIRGLRAYFDQYRDLDKFSKEINTDIDYVATGASPKPTMSVVDRMEQYEKSQEELKYADEKKRQDISNKSLNINKLTIQVYRLDSWLSSGGNKSWKKETFTALTEEQLFESLDYSESDFMNLLDIFYGDNTEAASRKLADLREQLRQEQINLGLLEKSTPTSNEFSYGSGEESLDSKTFKPYNLTRYAHVNKMFRRYETIGNLTIIRNQT